MTKPGAASSDRYKVEISSDALHANQFQIKIMEWLNRSRNCRTIASHSISPNHSISTVMNTINVQVVLSFIHLACRTTKRKMSGAPTDQLTMSKQKKENEAQSMDRCNQFIDVNPIELTPVANDVIALWNHYTVANCLLFFKVTMQMIIIECFFFHSFTNLCIFFLWCRCARTIVCGQIDHYVFASSSSAERTGLAAKTNIFSVIGFFMRCKSTIENNHVQLHRAKWLCVL